ncbi:MAG: glycosyltransferase family A protein [Pseudodesulfovibrio sp.]
MDETRRNRRGYAASDMAVVVPTKDRPDSVRTLLESLAAQTARPGLVVVVDGGRSVRSIVESFGDVFPVRYAECHPPAQIRQRKIGLGMLDDRTRLVACLDDKIVLEPEALERMVACWNRVEPETAGIGFNITNMAPSQPSRVYRLFGVTGERPGKVTWSGYNALFLNLTEDIRTQWLGGGYTVWRRDILDAHPQRDIQTRWAAGEDLRFSYPIGRKHPLWACADARLSNVTVTDQAPDEDVTVYRGKVIARHELYFGYSQPGISFGGALWMVLGRVAIDGFCGWRYSDEGQRLTARGRLQGLAKFFKVLLSGAPLENVLED